MKIIFYSHGLKKGPLPTGMDLYIDARGLTDAATSIGAPSGNNSPEVLKWFKDSYETKSGRVLTCIYGQLVWDAIASLKSRRSNNPYKPKDQLSVCCFCAWGMNRSPTLKRILAAYFVEFPEIETEVR